MTKLDEDSGSDQPFPLTSAAGRARRALGLASVIAALAFSSSGLADELDTVFLKDGGRLRGTVMVDDPKEGVQIKLPDGTVRSLKPGQAQRIEYAKPSAPAEPTATASALPAAPAAPTAPVVVASCPHQVVECPCSGETTGVRPCEPTTGQLLACQCPVIRRSGGMLASGIVMSTVGGLGVIGGLAAALVAASKGENRWDVAGVMLPISGAIMVTGIVLAAVGGRKSKATPLDTPVALAVTPTLNGLVLSGSF